MLLAYIVAVIIVAVLQDRYHVDVLSALAATPRRILHGQWWSLFSSGLVIDGPKAPQIAAILTLGSLGIYIGGSWLFWRISLLGHLAGTLVTYMGLLIARSVHPHWVHRLLSQPDYGVSLVWCAGLGALAAAAWYNRKSWKPQHPWLAALALGMIFAVTIWSNGIDAFEHPIAFMTGFAIMWANDRSREHTRTKLKHAPALS